ncbi:hypothetical protein PTKIN_Ptkin17bG0071200 [Pterospermum kingtungense]
MSKSNINSLYYISMKMKRAFSVKKDKEPPPSIQDAFDKINERGDTMDEKLKKLDAELSQYTKQIKKTRLGLLKRLLRLEPWGFSSKNECVDFKIKLLTKGGKRLKLTI